jgi:hypothetical protein
VADAVGGYAHLVSRDRNGDGRGGGGGRGGAATDADVGGGVAESGGSGGYSAAADQTWGRSAVLPAYGGSGGWAPGDVEGDLTVEETSPRPVRKAKAWGRSGLMATSTAVAVAKTGAGEGAGEAEALPSAMRALSVSKGGGASAATPDSGSERSPSADENQAPPGATALLASTPGGSGAPVAAGAGAGGEGPPAGRGFSPTPRAPETPPPTKAWGRSALLAEKVNGTTHAPAPTATAGA